jgi:hypothetical protein
VLGSETLAHLRFTTATPKALSHPWWDRAALGSDVDMTPASSASVRMFESVRALRAEGNLSSSDPKNVALEFVQPRPRRGRRDIRSRDTRLLSASG